MQRRYGGDKAEIGRRRSGDTEEMQRRYGASAEEVRRKRRGDTEET
jgi:hypothetical protein